MTEPDVLNLPSVRDFLVALESVVGSGVTLRPIAEQHEAAKPADDAGSTSGTAPSLTAPVHDGRRVVATLEWQTEALRSEAPETGAASPQDVLNLYARLLSRIIEQERELEHREAELRAVYRVSASLSGMADLDALLRMALETVMDVLDVSAGSIRLLDVKSDEPERETELVVRAAKNLSTEYFEKGPVIAGDSELDMRALAGEIVYVEDLAVDSRVRFPDIVKRERLRSFLCTGMVFGDHPIGVIRLYTRDNIRRFSEHDRGLLRAAAQQVAAALFNRRLVDEQRQARQIRRQLELAASVQQRMLPQHAPSHPTIDVAARCLPSLELGGDFYDFIHLDNDNLGFVIGDVVGKGIPAALMAASVKAGLRAHARYLYDLDEIMTRTNRDLERDTKPNEFATLWYGVLNLKSQRLTFCNAGHNPPFVLRRSTPTPEPGPSFLSLNTGGMIIGYDPDAEFAREVLDLHPGDVVVAFSDGLIDAMNFDQERYGLHRVEQDLINLLAADPGATAETIVNHLIWQVRRFVGFKHQSDDVTVVVLCVR